MTKLFFKKTQENDKQEFRILLSDLWEGGCGMAEHEGM